MKLTVKERVVLANLLPEQGDITSLKQIRVLRETLSFTDKENKDWNIEAESGMIRWDETKIKLAEIPVSEMMTKIIARKLRDLNKTKKLRDDMISLWDKFVPKK